MTTVTQEKPLVRTTSRPDCAVHKGVRMSMDGKGRWVDNVFVERVEERAAGKGEISTEASALILAHSGEPIVRETDVASAGVETA